MSKQKQQTPPNSETGFFMVPSYFINYFVNVVVLFLAGMWFPQQVVLGTAHISPMWAAIFSATLLALVGTLAIPFFHLYQTKTKKMLSPGGWMGGYLVIDFVALWLISRLADMVGLGISSWLVVLVLAAVLDFIQGIAMVGISSFLYPKKQ